jgi:hypothetical protein
MLSQPLKLSPAKEAQSTVTMETLAPKMFAMMLRDANSLMRNPLNAHNTANWTLIVQNGLLLTNSPQTAKSQNVTRLPPLATQLKMRLNLDANQSLKNANWSANQTMLVMSSLAIERLQDPTKSLVFTLQTNVTITWTALLTLAMKRPDANTNSKRLTNVLLHALKISTANNGVKPRNLQINANWHSVTSTAEAATRRQDLKPQNALRPTIAQLQTTAQPPNMDPLAVPKTEERNAANTNAELIPTVFLNLKKNGDTAERDHLDNSTVNTNQNVKEMKIAMTRTHVLVMSA